MTVMCSDLDIAKRAMSHQHGCLIREDIAEDVTRHHDVELLGPADELHRRVVHVHVRQVNLRVVLAALDHNVPPELHCDQHGRQVQHGTKHTKKKDRGQYEKFNSPQPRVYHV